jgi:hypothetical protein
MRRISEIAYINATKIIQSTGLAVQMKQPRCRPRTSNAPRRLATYALASNGLKIEPFRKEIDMIDDLAEARAKIDRVRERLERASYYFDRQLSVSGPSSFWRIS